MALTDIAARSAKPREKTYRISDANGLYLEISPTGGKWWRLKYRFGTKEKRLALGVYPEVSLKDAREKRAEARKLLANGVDPGEIKKAARTGHDECSENSFEVVAREWHTKFTPGWTASHAKTIIDRLTRDVFPALGARQIDKIKAPELLSALRRVEARGALETAHRIRTVCGQVFRYAIATGRAERDISADLKGALPPSIPSHLAAVTDPVKVAELLRAIDNYLGSSVVKGALQFASHTFVRPGELRLAEWTEFDLDGSTWNIPAARMKMKVAHLVPLSTQSLSILRELQAITGRRRFVFPCHRSKSRPMSNNAINAALRRMGYEKDEMTGHGFRAMARTILDEELQVRPDFIEHQLAHAVRDPLGRAYNRTSHLVERRKMMQVWSDYLDSLKAGT